MAFRQQVDDIRKERICKMMCVLSSDDDIRDYDGASSEDKAFFSDLISRIYGTVSEAREAAQTLSERFRCRVDVIRKEPGLPSASGDDPIASYYNGIMIVNRDWYDEDYFRYKSQLNEDHTPMTDEELETYRQRYG